MATIGRQPEKKSDRTSPVRHHVHMQKRRERAMDTTIEQAQYAAEGMANASGLPQTVYRNANSGGWWHTNALAPVLARSEMFTTVLPDRFFL